ncbi:glycosyltransferase [Chryseobacterium sp. DT-3]|uniref:glycosyltransferase n=1 Tax=Chryseobacterium sp. DT-3 TaxID=3396164 RepID=UPI003F1B2AA0
MNILYLFSTADTSVARVTLNQINALRKFYPNLKIKIACVNYEKNGSLLEQEDIYKKKKYQNKIVNYVKSLLFIKKVKKDFQPDITVSNQNAITTYNCIINKKDVKIGIFHAPNFQLKQRGALTFFLNVFSLRFIFPKLHALIGISQEVVNDLKGHIKDADIRLHYNIHNDDEIIKKSLLSSSIEIHNDQKINLLCLGTIDYNKRQDLIIKMVSTNKNVHVYIVGNIVDNDYYNKLVKLIEKNNLQKNITFIPFLSNPYPLIKAVDGLVSLSESEGLPGVIIESLILNNAVITTNSSFGVWEIFNEKNNYDKDLNSVYYCKKGIILPNPKTVDEIELLKMLDDSVQYLIKNKSNFNDAEFNFFNEISDESIHSFYNLLKEKHYENHNR